MPYKCSVPGCRSNYKAEDGYVSIFQFPSTKRSELRNKWIQSISRKDWEPMKCSAVCVKHFQDDDIIRYDVYKDRHGIQHTVLRRCPMLKPNAYPTIFPSNPENLRTRVQRRKESATRASEFQGRSTSDMSKVFKPGCLDGAESEDTETGNESVPADFSDSEIEDFQIIMNVTSDDEDSSSSFSPRISNVVGAVNFPDLDPEVNHVDSKLISSLPSLDDWQGELNNVHLHPAVKSEEFDNSQDVDRFSPVESHLLGAVKSEKPDSEHDGGSCCDSLRLSPPCMSQESKFRLSPPCTSQESKFRLPPPCTSQESKLRVNLSKVKREVEENTHDEGSAADEKLWAVCDTKPERLWDERETGPDVSWDADKIEHAELRYSELEEMDHRTEDGHCEPDSLTAEDKNVSEDHSQAHSSVYQSRMLSVSQRITHLLSTAGHRKSKARLKNQPRKKKVQRKASLSSTSPAGYCLVCNAPCTITENRKLPNLPFCKKCKKAYFYQMSQKNAYRKVCQDGGNCKIDYRQSANCPRCQHTKFKKVLLEADLLFKSSASRVTFYLRIICIIAHGLAISALLSGRPLSF